MNYESELIPIPMSSRQMQPLGLVRPEALKQHAIDSAPIDYDSLRRELIANKDQIQQSGNARAIKDWNLLWNSLPPQRAFDASDVPELAAIENKISEARERLQSQTGVNATRGIQGGDGYKYAKRGI